MGNDAPIDDATPTTSVHRENQWPSTSQYNLCHNAIGIISECMQYRSMYIQCTYIHVPVQCATTTTESAGAACNNNDRKCRRHRHQSIISHLNPPTPTEFGGKSATLQRMSTPHTCAHFRTFSLLRFCLDGSCEQGTTLGNWKCSCRNDGVWYGAEWGGNSLKRKFRGYTTTHHPYLLCRKRLNCCNLEVSPMFTMDKYHKYGQSRC